MSNVSTGTSDEEITVNEPMELQPSDTATEVQQSAFGDEQVGQKSAVLLLFFRFHGL